MRIGAFGEARGGEGGGLSGRNGREGKKRRESGRRCRGDIESIAIITVL